MFISRKFVVVWRSEGNRVRYVMLNVGLLSPSPESVTDLPLLAATINLI